MGARRRAPRSSRAAVAGRRAGLLRLSPLRAPLHQLVLDPAAQLRNPAKISTPGRRLQPDTKRTRTLWQLSWLGWRVGKPRVGAFSRSKIRPARTSWDLVPIKALRDDLRFVTFDQCRFGLAFDAENLGRITLKKRTSLLSNVPALDRLAKLCDGTHKHHVCLGKIKHLGRSLDLARLAGEYPSPLCAEWAEALGHELRSWSRGGVR